jgi:hypothetical protein
VSAAHPVAVTYLFSRECPSHEEGLRLLEDAALSAGVALDLETVEVLTDEQAERLSYVGSPTYRIAGEDPFAPEEPGHAFQFDACRAYRGPGGRIGPLPRRDALASALAERAGR